MSATKKMPLPTTPQTPPDLTATVNKAIALIDLLQSRLVDLASDEIFPALPGFDAITSSGICGIQTIADEVKTDLLKCANNL